MSRIYGGQKKKVLKQYVDLVEHCRASGIKYIVGIDEVAVGSIAGPMGVGLCAMPVGYTIEGLKDSKDIKNKNRHQYVEVIEQNFTHCVAMASCTEIDAHGMGKTKKRLMRQVVNDYLSTKPPEDTYVIVVDGAAEPTLTAVYLPKADHIVPAVMAAANVAKYYVDKVMVETLHPQYPMYGFDEHLGYTTQAHLSALRKYGPCEAHRFSCKPVRELL